VSCVKASSAKASHPIHTPLACWADHLSTGRQQSTASPRITCIHQCSAWLAPFFFINVAGQEIKSSIILAPTRGLTQGGPCSCLTVAKLVRHAVLCCLLPARGDGCWSATPTNTPGGAVSTWTSQHVSHRSQSGGRGSPVVDMEAKKH
jgi:hypothetical protein